MTTLTTEDGRYQAKREAAAEWGRRQERERRVICLRFGCTRLTWRNDAACSDECAAVVRP